MTSPRRSPFILLTAGPLLALSSLQAQVTYSGLVDIPISTNFVGVYLGIASEATSSPTINDPEAVTTDSYTVGYSEPADWDVNFFFGGKGIIYGETFQPFVDDTVGTFSQILNVASGTVIQSQAASRTLAAPSSGASGRPNGLLARDSHFDTPSLDANPAYSSFSSGQAGYIAFVLDPGPTEQYGWMRVTLANDENPGTIHEWAYSDEATFEVGQIPEPSSTILLILASLGLLRRKR